MSRDGTVRVGGVRMSLAAAICVEETGIDPSVDVASLRIEIELRGAEAASVNLAAQYLDGADDDRREGWDDYVTAIVLAVGDRPWLDGIASRALVPRPEEGP